MQLSQIPYPKYRFEDAIAETLRVEDWVSTWGTSGLDGPETTSLYMFEDTESTTNVPLSKECDVIAANLTYVLVDNALTSPNCATFLVCSRQLASV